jgi:thiosulfate dehydrogenase [quinone] large subunit
MAATHDERTVSRAEPRAVHEPLIESWAWTRALFAERNTVSGTIWLVVRLLLGWNWISGSVEKFGSYSSGWADGSVVQGFAKGGLAQMTGAHPSVIGGTFGWNKAWLTWVADTGYRFIGPIIPFLELTVGVLLVLGLFTGLGAALGLVMNLSFLFAGSDGVNPVYAVAALAIIAAWRVAGYYGLDRWVLPTVGVPWTRSREGSREAPDHG